MDRPDLELQALHRAVVDGDDATARRITREALAAGMEPLAIVNDYMAPAMDEVGRRFESGEYFVPQLLLSARSMKAGMEHIRPLLAARGAEPLGRIVLGTVQGDRHDIGKNLVGAMLEGGGFEVTDLGVNVAADRFIKALQDSGATVLAMSSLLTTTMGAMRDTIEALRRAGLRERVRVIVGGAAVTPQFAKEIGADGYGANAADTVPLTKRVLGLVAAA